ATAPPRDRLARPWLAITQSLDALAEASGPDAEILARAFTEYLLACRADEHALSTLPPGRFLMPGDLEGSPALTFAPLPAPQHPVRSSTLYAMLERRFEAYKSLVVRPFFRDHFARLDRQIVLVDALAALNAGPRAMADLESALAEILRAFRPGGANLLTGIFARRIDRILFAATKADHLHHTAHDRLENILDKLVDAAARRAKFAGAETRSLALAAIRATTEGTVDEDGETLPCIIGVPQKGEALDGVNYDGTTQIAFYPGDLPDFPGPLFDAGKTTSLKFLRFSPPTRDPATPGLPHIRLDRGLEFLIGDRMR
ncbi:MAG: YcjX family protein, partial [Cucumibacter sp.]